MPELPEVEIVKQSLKKSIKYKKIQEVIVRNRNLRFKVTRNFEKILKNKFITEVSRISKYIIIPNPLQPHSPHTGEAPGRLSLQKCRSAACLSFPGNGR